MPASRWRKSRFRRRRYFQSSSMKARIRASDVNLSPKSLEEINQYYKELFESVDIPFLTFYTFHSFTIPRRIYNFDLDRVNSERKSILSPYFIEPPMKFQSYRIVQTKEEDLEFYRGDMNGSTLYRLERLPPPAFTSMFQNMDIEWGRSDFQGSEVEQNIFVVRQKVCSRSFQIQKSITSTRKMKKRFKFHSDKNHDLSDQEDVSTLTPTIGPAYSIDSSYCSSTYEDSDSYLEDSGQGSSKGDSPLGESCGRKDSCEFYCTFEMSSGPRHNNEYFGSPLASDCSGSPRNKVQLETTPSYSKRKAKLESPLWSRYDNGYDSEGDQDILVIDLTQNEIDEFQ